MPIVPENCGPGPVNPLTCETDSVTVCQGTDPWIISGSIEVEIPPITVSLSCETDSITICPGEDPIVVSGTIELGATTLAALETVTVLQGTDPWTILGSVAVSNFPATVDVTQNTSPWVVSATDLDIRDLNCATDSVTICPGNDPIPVTVEGLTVSLSCETDSVTICPGADPIPVTLATVEVTQGTSPWVVSGTVSVNEPVTVDATDLDIRDLAFATDSVDVSGSTVTVSGTVSVNEPVTVDATDLDIRDLAFATDSVDVSGSEVALDATTLAALETITVNQGTSPWVTSGIVIGGYTPSDAQTNPTNLVGTENFNMVWGPGAVSGSPEWSRWGTYGIDDDSAGTGRVPGIAIFGRPETGLGETPQQAGVMNNLADDAEVFHSLAVASFPRLRDGNTPILGRQADGSVDANDPRTVAAVTPMVYNGTTFDRVRGDITNGLDVDVTRVTGTVTVGATDLDIRDLVFASDKVDVSGSSITVGATNLDIRDLVFASDKVDVSGSAVTVSATDLDIRNLAFASDTVDVSGSSVTVSATNLDIRDLAFATDKVDISGSSITVSGTSTSKELRSTTGGQSSVASSASNVTILASNSNRLGATVFNDSTQILYLKLGATASTTSYTVQMVAGSYYEVPFNYTGIIDGIWASANGNARVTELT